MDEERKKKMLVKMSTFKQTFRVGVVIIILKKKFNSYCRIVEQDRFQIWVCEDKIMVSY